MNSLRDCQPLINTKGFNHADMLINMGGGAEFLPQQTSTDRGTHTPRWKMNHSAATYKMCFNLNSGGFQDILRFRVKWFKFPEGYIKSLRRWGSIMATWAMSVQPLWAAVTLNIKNQSRQMSTFYNRTFMEHVGTTIITGGVPKHQKCSRWL